jgi:hypothetical protein
MLSVQQYRLARVPPPRAVAADKECHLSGKCCLAGGFPLPPAVMGDPLCLNIGWRCGAPGRHLTARWTVVGGHLRPVRCRTASEACRQPPP